MGDGNLVSVFGSTSIKPGFWLVGRRIGGLGWVLELREKEGGMALFIEVGGVVWGLCTVEGLCGCGCELRLFYRFMH